MTLHVAVVHTNDISQMCVAGEVTKKHKQGKTFDKVSAGKTAT